MHVSQIDTNLLVVLDALLAESSVTRAASRIGLSQSAVSHALGRLRDALGDPLLVRAGRSMVLTPRAEFLAPRVRRVIGDIAAIFADHDQFEPASLRRAFRLHTTDHVQFVLIPDVDAALASEAPSVDLHISSITGDSTDVLRSGAVDLAIGVFPELPPDLQQQPLFNDRFVCVVRRDHPTVKETLSLSQYAALPHLLVAPRGEPRGIVDRLLADHGVTRRVARSVPHFLVAPFLIERSDYVLTVSERIISTYARILDLRVLPPPLPLEPYTLAQVWHRRNAADPAHRWLRETAMRVASGLPALTAIRPPTGKRKNKRRRSRR